MLTKNIFFFEILFHSFQIHLDASDYCHSLVTPFCLKWPAILQNKVNSLHHQYTTHVRCKFYLSLYFRCNLKHQLKTITIRALLHGLQASK